MNHASVQNFGYIELFCNRLRSLFFCVLGALRLVFARLSFLLWRIGITFVPMRTTPVFVLAFPSAVPDATGALNASRRHSFARAVFTTKIKFESSAQTACSIVHRNVALSNDVVLMLSLAFLAMPTSPVLFLNTRVSTNGH